LLNAHTFFIADAEIVLRLGKPLFRGFAQPFRGLLFVFLNTSAKEIVSAEIALCLGIALFGGFLKLFYIPAEGTRRKRGGENETAQNKRTEKKLHDNLLCFFHAGTRPA
jgi:hypothetical protein